MLQRLVELMGGGVRGVGGGGEAVVVTVGGCGHVVESRRIVWRGMRGIVPRTGTSTSVL